ncbi:MULTISPECIES: carbohydrate ABC transporter permease [Niveibacterium]|uniref:Carbohydrate ABC transporter permease n=1 Tax=Niveibacterium microcysteis TaxID=2811415 RepID=A0ABX7M909_9RHOO|nr:MULTISPECIES: carbohydrate ABC transporter permease [Niveibacterium]QSI77233.1 carbohydrate ABC transporter permease [Niveibacterium microcysteis]
MAAVRKRVSPSRWLAYVIVALGGVIMLAPFWFMFVFATHTNTEILSVPPPLWFGTAFIENVRLLIEKLPFFWRNLGLSFFIAFSVTVLNLFFCSLAGYAFAMYHFKFRESLFAVIMATMMLPAFIFMIPTVLIMSAIGWMNEAKALIVPGACGAFGIFMMRQFIGTAIPKELVEAARIDGCSEFGIFWRIVLPLVTPALGSLGLITFIGTWNNFAGPLVIMRDMDMFTVPLALRALQGTGQVPWGAISAGSAIAVLPLMVLFVIASRRLIEGLTSGAVKG